MNIPHWGDTWELQKSKILVVEDTNTASLVVVAKELNNKEEKIAALEEVVRSLRE